MRRLALVVLAVLATSAPASASPPCHLITDPRGDATSSPTSPASRDDLDILSVDLDVRAGRVATTMRVQHLAEGPPLVSGAQYDVFVTRDGLEYTAEAYLDAQGERFSVHTGMLTDPAHPYRFVDVSGTFDRGRSEIRVLAPLAAFTPDGGGGRSRSFTDIGAQTGDLAASAVVYVGSSADQAGGSVTYVPGQRRCMTAAPGGG